MSDNLMSRRKFLAGTGLVLGAASVSGVALLKDADPAEAAGTAIPWAYPADPAQQPEPGGSRPPRLRDLLQVGLRGGRLVLLR